MKSSKNGNASFKALPISNGVNAPLLGIGISLALGIVLQRYVPGFSMAGSLVTLVVGVVLLWCLRGRRHFFASLMVVLVLVGFSRASLEKIKLDNPVKDSIAWYWMELEGRVISQPKIKKKGRRVIASFILEAEKIGRKTKKAQTKKNVVGKVQVFWIQPGFIPEAGDRVRLSGKLEAPRRALTPGVFNYAEYLSQRNIFSIFQPIGKQNGQLLSRAPPWDFARLIGKMRQHLSVLIDRLYTMPQSSILKALVFGVRSDIDPVIRNTFMKTGTIHLLAISGLNITMIAGSFFLIFLFLKLPRKLTTVLTMLIVAIYVPLAGSGIPIQRAGIMALVVLLAVLMGRATYVLNALCAAFVMILWMDPSSLWNIGFQLSFLCVLSLVVVFPLFPKHHLFTLSIGGSLAVLVGTFPVVLYYFNTFSPIGVLANLIAIPLCDAALFTTLFALLFYWVPLLGSALVMLSSGIVSLSLAWIRGLSVWRFGYWFFVKPEAWQLWGYYGALVLMLMMSRFRIPMKKIVLGVCLLCWGVSAFSMLRVDNPQHFRLTVLAGGKEPILHVHFLNGADWLVNAGRNFPSNQGERLVLPYLKQHGMKEVDGILLTDFYKKHRGGLQAILRDVTTQEIIFPGSDNRPLDFIELIKNSKTAARAAKKGMRLDFGDEALTVLKTERRGMAILIESDPQSILFVSHLALLTLDVVEQADPDILVLPYLKSSIPEEIVEFLVKKRVRWVLAGADFRVLRGLKRAGLRYLDLNKTGALVMTPGKERLSLSSYIMGAV